jgi:uncharacterized protein with PIN domain
VLEPVAKNQVVDRLLPKTRQYYDDFSQCLGCGNLYWKGSHYERMLRFVDAVRNQLREMEQLSEERH